VDCAKAIVGAKALLDLCAGIAYASQGKGPLAWMFLAFCVADTAMVYL
jgi:hypothetical protein